MRIILLLSNLFSLLFSFSELFHYNMKNFDVIETQKSYKLILKNQHYFDYSKNGFKFFLPKFTTEFNLNILRFNSTGFISGYLSINKKFSNVLNVSPINLKYYMTNYKSFQRQLDFLLKNYTIPYKKVTSISMEGYNIPPKIYQNLNKFIYFKIDHSEDYYNSLKYLVYSFYIVLDKTRLNKFLQNKKITFKNFINNIYKINFKILPVKKRKKENIPYALKLHLFLYMKKFGFIPQNKKYTIKTNIDDEKMINLYSKLNDLKFDLKNSFNGMLSINPQKKIDKFSEKLDNIANKISHLNFYAKIEIPKCIDYNHTNQECFKNITYFHNYTYFQLKRNQVPNINVLLKYGDYKTFNDVAKYYFERGNFNKAEILLQKAYALQPNPIIIHNLSVLYLTYSPLFNIKKAVNYIIEASLPIDYYNLGVLYYIGKGVKENNKKAREYFLKSPSIPYSKENIKIMNKYKIGIN